MANSENKHIPTTEGFQAVSNDVHYHDVFAEIAGITEFNVDGVRFVNLSFFSHRVVPFADQEGRPSVSKIDLKRVASITMTSDRAEALREALNANLGNTSGKVGIKK